MTEKTGVSFVVRVQNRVACVIRRLASQEPETTISLVICRALRLRLALNGALKGDDPSEYQFLGRQTIKNQLVLLHAKIPEDLMVMVQELARNSGKSYGLLVAEGVEAYSASLGRTKPVQGLNRLPRGRISARRRCNDQEVFVILG